VARKIGEWIHRLGAVWVEGQVTQISMRPGTQTGFLTLRDPSADVSMNVTCATRLLQALDPPLREGASVVLHAKPSFFLGRGSISLRASEIRPVGIGELLARIERLRKLLDAEGLFSPARKRPLPFLPKSIGLITGRASAAEHDVLVNAQGRWPAVAFQVINTAIQGPQAVPQILKALSILDADPAVEVIVIARGGGSVEDLLPFSDEALIRAVAAAGTPVVSAIGHEPDNPVLDQVADLRCSTPTDAAKRIVPDVKEETQRVRQMRDRARRALHGWVDTQTRLLTQLRSRPVLADPLAPIARQEEAVESHLGRSRRAMLHRITAEQATLSSASAKLATLGPSATLARGYAVVQFSDKNGKLHVLRSISEVEEGASLRVRLTDGALHAAVESAKQPAEITGENPGTATKMAETSTDGSART
jgi:exodeoxyribonuclease VII large subunit